MPKLKHSIDCLNTMAIRKKLNHDTRTREKIQASQIINALTNHVFGKNNMEASQVTAALGLLRKTLPDLQAIEMDVTTEVNLDTLSTAALIDHAKQLIDKAGTSESKLTH